MSGRTCRTKHGPWRNYSLSIRRFWGKGERWKRKLERGRPDTQARGIKTANVGLQRSMPQRHNQGDGVMIVGEQIEEESSCIEDLFFLSFHLVIQARTAQDPGYRSGFTFIKFFLYHSSYTCLFVCHFLISISP